MTKPRSGSPPTPTSTPGSPLGWLNQRRRTRSWCFLPAGRAIDGKCYLVPGDATLQTLHVTGIPVPYLQDLLIYHQMAYVQLPLLTFTREVLELAPEARERALAKIRRLEESFLCPVKNLRPP